VTACHNLQKGGAGHHRTPGGAPAKGPIPSRHAAKGTFPPSSASSGAAGSTGRLTRNRLPRLRASSAPRTSKRKLKPTGMQKERTCRWGPGHVGRAYPRLIGRGRESGKTWEQKGTKGRFWGNKILYGCPHNESRGEREAVTTETERRPN